MEVLCPLDYLDLPAALLRLVCGLPVTLREEQIPARYALPSWRARNLLLEEAERDGRHLAYECLAQGVVRHFFAHCCFPEPARPGRQDSVYCERAELVEQRLWHERSFAGARRHSGIDKDQAAHRLREGVGDDRQQRAAAAVADKHDGLR
jgi:hypothetical protein